MSQKRKLPASTMKSEFYLQSTAHVPGDVFLACIHVYQNAARMTLPVTNPMEYKFRIEGKLYGFADRPENRGMLAVKEFLGDDQSSFFPATACRLMSCSGAMKRLRAQKRFATFFRPDDEGGDWMVSEALLKAFATAAFKRGELDIDLNSVHKEATRLLAEDPD